MRIHVALCAFLMLGVGATSGCSEPPPAKHAEGAPAPKKKREKKPKIRKVSAPPPTDFAMVGEVIKLPGPVVFETGSDKLKPESDVVLQHVADYLEAKPNITLLRIEGHTDNDGQAGANQTLSEKRARAVAHWLTEVGIACDRLLPVGFGQTKPVAGTVEKQSKDEKDQNRRVSFVNAAANGKVLGGTPPDGGGHPAGDPCE